MTFPVRPKSLSRLQETTSPPTIATTFPPTITKTFPPTIATTSPQIAGTLSPPIVLREMTSPPVLHVNPTPPPLLATPPNLLTLQLLGFVLSTLPLLLLQPKTHTREAGSRSLRSRSCQPPRLPASIIHWRMILNLPDLITQWHLRMRRVAIMRGK